MSASTMTSPGLTMPVRHIHKNDGEARALLGSIMRFKVSSSETLGQFCICEGIVSQNTQVPLHYHPDVEPFIVLDGAVDVLRVSEGSPESVRLTAGDIALIPSNAVHGVSNRGGKDARVLIVCGAGIEAFFAEAGTLVDPSHPAATNAPMPQDIERVLSIAGKHGQVFVNFG